MVFVFFNIQTYDNICEKKTISDLNVYSSCGEDVMCSLMY